MMYGRPMANHRRITDPQRIRALTHPLRLELMEVLGDGPATATQCAMVATFAGVEPGDDTTGQVSANGTSYILFGTADSNEFRTVAASVGTELTEAETAQPDGAGE